MAKKPIIWTDLQSSDWANHDTLLMHNIKRNVASKKEEKLLSLFHSCFWVTHSSLHNGPKTHKIDRFTKFRLRWKIEQTMTYLLIMHDLRKFVIARKSGKKRYSFSIPLWFALRHHFFVEKTMSYVILGNDRICPFLTKKKTKKYYGAKLIFWSFATFFGLIFFRSGAK